MAKLLWRPSEERIQGTNMHRFMNFVNAKFDQNFSEYDPLYRWSINNISDFWAATWEFVKIKASKSYDQVIDDETKMPGARWFSGSRLNFAENLLRFRDDQTALVFRGEDRVSRKMTYAELYDETARVARSLKTVGVQAGDRVAGFMPNMPETIIAMLAAASIGATWSSCSPDFGTKGVLDRFGQIEPKVLFTADGYFFKGKHFDSLEKISNIIKEIPSIEKVVVVSYTQKNPDIKVVPTGVHYKDFRSSESDLNIEFAQLPFDHPLYIMYSSGTTGLPKCMVQSAGGILIHHLKELVLHTDLKREDTIFYFTTCSWMMWNWLVSSLAVGATLLTVINRKFKMETLQAVMISTVRLTCMVFIILCGAAAFGLVFRGLNGDALVRGFLGGLAHKYSHGHVLAIVMALIFVIGFFLDFIEITFIHVPVLAPIMIDFGYDPVWFCILIAVNLQTSFMTPPFGFSLFYLKAVTPPEITTGNIYRGIIPFVAFQLVGLLIVVFFPKLATWLPSVVFGP